MCLDLPDGHGALDLSWLEQSGGCSFQLHGNQVEVAIADNISTNKSLKVVDLNFDPALHQPQAKVLAGGVGQDEKQTAWLSGANEHGYDYGTPRIVV